MSMILPVSDAGPFMRENTKMGSYRKARCIKSTFHPIFLGACASENLLTEYILPLE